MPQLSLSTNVPVDAVVASDIIRDCSRALARIIGKPESVTPLSSLLSAHSFCSTECLRIMCLHESFTLAQYVMVSIDGSTPMSFARSEEPAAYGEIMSIGGLGPGVNGKLSAALAEILEAKLSISGSRFYVKFDDVQVRPTHPSHLCPHSSTDHICY
jgi:phenylpyruvate tautomerase